MFCSRRNKIPHIYEIHVHDQFHFMAKGGKKLEVLTFWLNWIPLFVNFLDYQYAIFHIWSKSTYLICHPCFDAMYLIHYDSEAIEIHPNYHKKSLAEFFWIKK